METEKMNGPEKRFYEFGLKTFKAWGMDTLSSKLVCMLYMENDKVAISDLAEITGYSLASVSNKLKALEAFGMIEKKKIAGSKKIYYYMESDIIKQFEKKMMLAYKIEVEPAKDLLPSIISDYKGIKLSKEEKNRKKAIESYYDQILKMDIIFSDMKKIIAKRRKD